MDLGMRYRMVCRLKVSFEVMSTAPDILSFCRTCYNKERHSFTFRMSVSHSVSPYVHNNIDSNVTTRFFS